MVRKPAIYQYASSGCFVWKYLLVAPDSRVVNTLLECALEVRDGFGTAPKSHFLAEIISALTADATLTAGNPNF